MRAIVYRTYGSPNVLHCEQPATPTPTDDQVLIRVRAASVNPYDWHVMRGSPYIMRMLSGLTRPKDIRVGVDAGLMKTGAVTPVIDRGYRLDEVPDAIRYLEQGHARGKVVITVA